MDEILKDKIAVLDGEIKRDQLILGMMTSLDHELIQKFIQESKHSHIYLIDQKDYLNAQVKFHKAYQNCLINCQKRNLELADAFREKTSLYGLELYISGKKMGERKLEIDLCYKITSVTKNSQIFIDYIKEELEA